MATWTHEIDALVRELHDKGIGADRIAGAVPFCTQSVLRRIRKLKLSGFIPDARSRRPGMIEWDDVDDRFRECVRKGMTIQQIADLLKISRPSIHNRMRALKAAGDPDFQGAKDPFKQLVWSPGMLDTLRARYVAGVKFRDIAGEIGVTVHNCEDRVKKLREAGDDDFAPRGRGWSNGKTSTAEKIVKRAEPSFMSASLPSFPSLPHSRRVGIDALSADDCRWLDDDGCWCGLSVSRGSYCKDHASIVYRKAA